MHKDLVPNQTSSISSPRHSIYLIPLAITAITLTITMVAGYITQKAVDTKLQDFFNRQADQIANTYYNKLHTHITILEGLRGLWNASGDFTQDSFTKYVESIDLSSIEKSGVSSYFYVPAVKRRDISSFTTTVKKQPNLPTAYSTFTIHPKSQSDIYYPALYAVPLKGRESSIGLDFGTFPERLAAINYARDKNSLATTNAVTLLTTGKSGFFFLIPLYHPSQPLERTRERQEAFAGVVGATFRSESAFEQIFGDINPYPYLNFHIYQGDAVTDDRLLYDSNPKFNHLKPRFTATRKVSIQDQSWTIVVESNPSYSLMDSEQQLPIIVFGSGLIATIILAVFSAYNLAKIRHSR